MPQLTVMAAVSDAPDEPKVAEGRFLGEVSAQMGLMKEEPAGALRRFEAGAVAAAVAAEVAVQSVVVSPDGGAADEVELVARVVFHFAVMALGSSAVNTFLPIT